MERIILRRTNRLDGTFSSLPRVSANLGFEFSLFPESYRQHQHPNRGTAEVPGALCYLKDYESEAVAARRPFSVIERAEPSPFAFQHRTRG
jgi:hypothetical protein